MHSSWHSVTRQLGPVALAALLTACGGGGSSNPSSTSGPTVPGNSAASPAPAPSDTATPAPSPPDKMGSMPVPTSAPVGVFISEIANNDYSNSASWIEVYNNSGANIELGNYSLRAPAFNLSTQARTETATFALPRLTLRPNEYVVIASRVSSDLQNTASSVYISNAQNQVPYWQGDSGFVELIAAGSTVDFVAFGSNTTKPVTANAWSGINVPAMSQTADSYNTAIVRPFTRFRQTRSASDWAQVNFTTPGGINDVPAGVTDSDNDGIPDSAKVAGGTYAGQDLYAMGARKGQRDLFIHVDYMNSPDAGVKPQASALDKIVQAFQKRNIAVHFDVGNLFAASIDASKHNLSGDVSHQRSHASCTELLAPSKLTAGCTSLYAIKSAHFEIRRKPVFRYLLMANSQAPNGSEAASGSAEFLGDDFMVTLGGWGLAAGSTRLMNYQAATIMHELGHTLGLRHGGHEDAVNKPNYYSVMNYFYQMTGLPNPQGQGVSQRYYYWLTHYQNQSANGYTKSNPFPESQLEEGPHALTFNIDYSDGSSQPLNEDALLESQLIGRGSATGYFADWSGNGIDDQTLLKKDLNYSGSNSILNDHNDWASLVLSSRRNANTNNSGIGMASTAKPAPNVRAFDPVATPFQHVITEEAPLITHMRLQQ